LKPVKLRGIGQTKAIEAYENANNKESPLIESRLKTIGDDIKVNEKKSQNIIQRIEELPSELSAELFINASRKSTRRLKN